MKTLILLFSMTLFVQSSYALHLYAGYNCKAGSIELKYDGPGSNYAVGGYSNFYAENGEAKFLSYELYDPEEDPSGIIGEEIAGQVTGVLFTTEEYTSITPAKYDIAVGDKCEPNEFDYVSSDWKTKQTVLIQAISEEASNKLGIKKGDKVDFTCDSWQAEPIRCPEGGVYTEEVLGHY